MSKIAVCQTMVKQPLSVIGEVDQPCFAAAKCQPVNDFSNIGVSEVHAVVVLVEEAHFPFGKNSGGVLPGSKVRKTCGVSFFVAKMAAFHVKENDRLRIAG